MTPPRLAAVIYQPGTDPAPMLEQAVRILGARGVALAGALQHGTGECMMELELLPSRRRISISQDLGSGAGGCRLDTSALAEAGSLVRQAIHDGAGIAVFNKFGAQEAGGYGLHAEITAAVMADVPVLIPVGERFMAEWTEFTGGEFIALPCTTEAVLGWWDALSTGGSAGEAGQA